jgi:ABC-2 type transport system ATP-binding protein
LRTADRGEIRVFGVDPRLDARTLHERVGVQLQHSALPERLKVGEAVELYASFYDHPADGNELLAALGLEPARNRYFKRLSGGQRQRLSIVLALIGRPAIAVLDELTTGLDPQARRDTWGLVEDIRAKGVTVVLVTHFMAEAERLCDRIAVIDDGRVVALDTPAGLVSAVAAEQRIRFRPSVPVPDGLLADLPEVTSVRQVGPQLHVTGTGDVLQAVTSVLARHRIVAAELRVEQASLDDAFVALTGKKLEDAR